MTADVPHSVLVQRPNLLAPVWVPAIPPRALIFHLQRRYNTLSLLDYYLGHGKMSNRDIAWSAADPNLLSMTLPGGLDVTTRVTRRSENESPPNRLDTSEYFQQVCCYQNGVLTLAHHLRLITASPVPTQISGIWVFQGTLPDCLDTSEYFQQVRPALATPGARTHPSLLLPWRLLALCLLSRLLSFSCSEGDTGPGSGSSLQAHASSVPA